jgi:hypothetical protein
MFCLRTEFYAIVVLEGSTILTERTVLSYDLDTTRLLSGEKTTEVTASKWASSVCSAVPVTASYSCTVLSPDLDATSLPSGEKDTE